MAHTRFAFRESSAKSVLFLCTGNYYRSRFAEELFNHHAGLSGLSWMARSAALAIERCAVNIGPLSPHTIQALKARCIQAARASHKPQQCTIADLTTADLIIAMDEAEHRSILLERFDEWADRVTYWHVKDVDAWQPAFALGLMEREVVALVSKLARSSNQIENVNKGLQTPFRGSL